MKIVLTASFELAPGESLPISADTAALPIRTESALESLWIREEPAPDAVGGKKLLIDAKLDSTGALYKAIGDRLREDVAKIAK